MYVPFDHLLNLINSKHATFECSIDEDPVALQGLRELTLRRNMSVCKESYKSSPGDLDVLADWLTKYIGLLRQFITKLKAIGAPYQNVAGRGGFLWSSPTSQLPPTAHFSLDSVILEEMMTLIMYALLLQEQAQKLCSDLLKASLQAGDAQGSSEDIQQQLQQLGEPLVAAALFRKAAGICAHVRTVLLPTALSDIPPDAPCEVSVVALDCLESVALARAQGVAAFRAEQKGVSPAALAAVHMGAVELWEAAATQARLYAPSRPASLRFQRYLAVCSGLHEAKALRARAAIWREENELGKAVACLKLAASKVNQCLMVTEGDTPWKESFKQELKFIDAAFKVYDKERTSVHLQVVPPQLAPQLPGGKIVVGPAAFETPPCDDHFFM